MNKKESAAAASIVAAMLFGIAQLYTAVLGGVDAYAAQMDKAVALSEQQSSTALGK